jgi:hypothetical protein
MAFADECFTNIPAPNEDPHQRPPVAILSLPSDGDSARAEKAGQALFRLEP